MTVSQWGPQTGKVTGPGEGLLCTETGKQLNGSQGEEEPEERLGSGSWGSGASWWPLAAVGTCSPAGELP